MAQNVAQTEDEIDQKRVEDCLEKAGLGANQSPFPDHTKPV